MAEDSCFVIPSRKSFAIRKAPLKSPSAVKRLTVSVFFSIQLTALVMGCLILSFYPF